MKKVIVELKVAAGSDMEAMMKTDEAKFDGFKIDSDYEPVPIRPEEDLAASPEKTYEAIVLIRGELDEKKEEVFRKMPNVINIWTDSRIEGFNNADDEISLTL